MAKRNRFFVACDDCARKHVRAAESRGQSAFERVPVNRVRVLRDKGIFSEYQAWGNPACTNVGRLAVYVFRAERVYGRVCAMDETGRRAVSDGVYADDVIVCRADDVFGEYAAGAWNNACGKRSAENSATIRFGQFDEIQYDERGTRDDHGDQFKPRHSKERQMKENNELERKDIAVDRSMDVDGEDATEITAYIETWFDVDKKFGTSTKDDDDVWLNVYAKYNPFDDTLRIECEIDKPKGSEYFDYTPTETEEKLIKDMIAETIQAEYGQTPQEFCGQFQKREQTMG